MSETSQETNQPSTEEVQIVEAGPISRRFTDAGWDHEFLGVDHLGVEILKVDRDGLIPFANALYDDGFNYLQCQGGYDAGPGEELVSMYHLVKVSDDADRPKNYVSKCFYPERIPVWPQCIGSGKPQTGKNGKPTTCMALSMRVIPT